MFDRHSKGRAPITDVVARDDGVSEESIHPGQGVADHRRTKVSHVHLLGHVGRRVIKNDPKGSVRWRQAQSGVERDRAELVVHEPREQREV